MSDAIIINLNLPIYCVDVLSFMSIVCGFIHIISQVFVVVQPFDHQTTVYHDAPIFFTQIGSLTRYMHDSLKFW